MIGLNSGKLPPQYLQTKRVRKLAQSCRLITYKTIRKFVSSGVAVRRDQRLGVRQGVRQRRCYKRVSHHEDGNIDSRRAVLKV